jgi:hypothetical protein
VATTFDLGPTFFVQLDQTCLIYLEMLAVLEMAVTLEM